jgi:transitional endoplasmic reticulum ATPase
MHFSHRTRIAGNLKRGLILFARGSFFLVRTVALFWSTSGPALKGLVFVLSYLLLANYQATDHIDSAYDWRKALDVLDPRLFWLFIKTLVFFLALQIIGRTLQWPASNQRTVTSLRADRPVSRPAPSAEQRPINKEYPKFADVGGLETVKWQIADLIKTRLDGAAAKYGIIRNGILLYGPTGSGKSLLAEATANEFGLNFCYVALSDLLSGYVFHSVDKIAGEFARAAEKKPALIFLDEFDAVAGRREVARHPDHIAATNQMLQSIDRYRADPGVILVAATNLYHQLDPAIIRPGRFDLHLQIDYPDAGGRKRIIEARLRNRPWKKSDLAPIIERTEGWSPAKLAALVDQAALHAYRSQREITTQDLQDAVSSVSLREPSIMLDYRLDDLILPEDILSDIRHLVRLLSRPDDARRLNLEPPTGILLKGPPGTGKTMIARAIAVETDHSFYCVTPKDVMNLFVGESCRNMSIIFDRAKEHAPSILFFDDMDALLAQRDHESLGKLHPVSIEVVNQFLLETNSLSASSRVFLIGATNRPEAIDPAVVRGGRFSEQIEIPLPSFHLRIRFFQRYLSGRSLETNLTYEKLAGMAEGFTGAGIQALCNSALQSASARALSENKPLILRHHDFRKALQKCQKLIHSSCPTLK